MTALFVAGTLLAFFVLAYVAAPLALWTAAAGAALAIASQVFAFPLAANMALATVFVLVAAVLNIPVLRHAVP